MNNKKLFIEVEYTEYSPLVNDRLYKLAKNGGEIMPGLKVVNIVDEITHSINEQNKKIKTNNHPAPKTNQHNTTTSLENNMPTFSI